jgi:hypothetical protein
LRAVIAACSPIDRPVRGSALRGTSGGLRRVGLHQQATQVVVDAQRRVGGRVHAAGDRHVGLAELDLVGGEDRRLDPGVARLLDVEGGRRVVQRGAHHALADEVEVARVLEHGAGHDLVDGLAGEPEAGDQAVERAGEHVLVGRLRVGAVGSGKRNPVAAEDRGPAGECGLRLGSHVTSKNVTSNRVADR